MAHLMRHPFIPLLLTALLSSGCSTVSALWQHAPASGSKPSSKKHAVEARLLESPGSTAIKKLWENNLDQRRPDSPPGFSLPTVIPAAGGDVIVAGAQDSRLRGYNAGGDEIMHMRIALAYPGESGGLQLSNGLVVVGDVGGNLYGLDLQHGVIKWHNALSSALIGKPAPVGNDFVIETSNNQIYRFTADGKKVWSYSESLGGLAMHLSPSPVVYKGRLFASLSNGDVVAMSAADGGFLWKRHTLLKHNAAVLSELKVPVASPVVIPAAQSGRDEDMLAVPVFQGKLMFLSLQDGSTLKTRNFSLKASPLLIGHTLFVADTQGAVSALDAGSGDVLWKTQLSTGELTGPVLAHGLLWLADDHGWVYRIDQDGRTAGRIALAGRIDRTPVAIGDGVLVRNNYGVLYMLR